jgi:hypothetical protein
VAARYRVELTSKAKRQLSALPKNLRKRIDVRLLALADNPRLKLHAQENRYRIRVGDLGDRAGDRARPRFRGSGKAGRTDKGFLTT